MSVQASAWAWRQRDRFDNPNAFLVLLALAEHADPTGRCWPSRGTIARMVGFASKEAVTRNINKLIEVGLVEKSDRHEAKSGRRTSNVYLLHLEDGSPGEGDRCDHGGGDQAGTGEPVTAGITPGTTSSEPSEGTTNRAVDPAFDPEVVQVWEHYCKVFQPPRAVLGPNRARGIKRALREVPGPEDLCAAVDGLHEYRKRRPGETTIETIWKTFRDTGSMSERIEFFISQAPQTTTGGVRIPSVLRAIVAQRKLDIERGHQSPDDRRAVGIAQEAEAWLLEHGIATVRHGDDRLPTFEPVTPQDES